LSFGFYLNRIFMPANQRSCLPCTACCEGWLDIAEVSVQAHVGKPCQSCTSQGCGIYESRPVNPCQTFLCAWRQDDTPLIDEMRPDLSNVIVVMDRMVWRDQKVIVAIPRGEKIPEKSQQYLFGLSKVMQLNLLTVRFVVDGFDQFTGSSRLSAFGENEFVEDMKERFKDGVLSW
jgi:hypothetical protein